MLHTRSPLALLGLVLAGLMLSGCTSSPAYDRSGSMAKVTLGATETFVVGEADMPFLARIDTGAAATSIHAVAISVEDGEEDMRNNAGKPVQFTVVNADGEAATLTARIAAVGQVRNSQGIEYRYYVPLTLSAAGRSKQVFVSLRNRDAMHYKLLVGRDWLKGTAVVDVEQARHPRARR